MIVATIAITLSRIVVVMLIVAIVAAVEIGVTALILVVVRQLPVLKPDAA